MGNMSKAGWVCALCQKQSAGFFCDCSDPEVFLCELCIGKHYARQPGKMHHCLPVAAYGQHCSPGFYERFAVRSGAFDRRVTSLRSSLSKIDRCSEEFNQKISQIIADIQEFKTATTQKLAKLKAELSSRLDRASQLVGESLYVDPNPSEDPIVQALRSGQETDEELSMFSYRLNDSRAREVVEQLLLYETQIAGETMSEELLPGITGTTLSLYNGTGGIARQIDLAFAFEKGTMVVYVNREVYFLECGGRMFSMNIERMELIQMPSKENTVYSFGVHAETKAIYVFGGEREKTLRFGALVLYTRI